MSTNELIERGIGHNCLSDAYDLGRQDEREEWECAVADKIIKHNEDIYTAFPEVIEKVRNDVIDEIEEDIRREFPECGYIADYVRQLKDQTE